MPRRAGGAGGARRVRDRLAAIKRNDAPVAMARGAGRPRAADRLRHQRRFRADGAGGGARAGTDLAWRHQLTDQERMLRDLAYPLIEPPYERNKWYSAIGEVGAASRPWPYPDRTAYASRLFTTAYRSQTARYNRLIEDIRNDVMRIDPFFNSARYVIEMDRKREKALGYVTSLTVEERDNTLLRVAENRNIVRWVQESLQERAESYKFALERMVIAAPSPVAVEAERALTLLQQRITSYGA
jgi:hypothetical protein